MMASVIEVVRGRRKDGEDEEMEGGGVGEGGGGGVWGFWVNCVVGE